MTGRLSALVLFTAVAVTACAICAAAASAATVTKTVDTDDGVCNADCSLREAIDVAAPGETVSVPASATPYEVTDGLESLVIEKDLVIAGAGARQTEVTAPGTLVRPFTIRSPTLTIPNVTIRDISITGGDGFGGGYGGQGGGVLAVKPGPSLAGPVVVLERVRVAGNTASVSSTAQAVGGGVTVDGQGTQMTIRDSLISGNKAVGSGESQATGGGVATFTLGTVTIENTTISDNEALADSPINNQSALGGGVVIGSGSSLSNVTLVGNTAKRTTGLAVEGRGGNFVASSQATVRNTIITGGAADEAGTEDCVEPLGVRSLGGNVVPASCGPGASDRTVADPLLGPLTNNGGQTDTMALLAGSPAIDAGLSCPPPATDQRSFPRPSGPACDAGAYELQVPGPDSVLVQVIKKKKKAKKKKKKKEKAPLITCQGKKATLVGDARRNTLKGTRKADVIVALAGNDVIRARGGNDLVCAGRGKDVVRGGPGKDLLLGQRGADRLFGGPGLDQLLGGAGQDLQRQ